MQAFETLDLERGHYEEVATLILSHNKLTRLDAKILSLRPERGLRVDHNLLTGITWDLSLLLQSFQVMITCPGPYPDNTFVQDNRVTLGHNPWLCDCNAEITNRVKILNSRHFLSLFTSKHQIY